MNLAKFTIYTAAGCIPWVLMLGFIGVKVGENWEEWRDKLHYFDYVVLAGPDRARRLRLRQVAPRRRWRRPTPESARGEAETVVRDRGLSGCPRTSDPSRSRRRSDARAIALGAVQGPAELLPDLELRPPVADPLARRLGLGPPRRRAAQELRDRAARRRRRGAAARPAPGDRRRARAASTGARASVIALSFLPPGRRRPRARAPDRGEPRRAASDGDRAARRRRRDGARRPRPKHRSRSRAGAVDGLALGLAQAAALAPGVSRNGATLTAARWRGFARAHANMLSRTVALPVIVSAAVLKAARLRRRGLPAEHRAAFVAGHGHLVRLDPRLAGPDRARRARQRPVALLGLPRGPRRASSWRGSPRRRRRRARAGRGDGRRRQRPRPTRRPAATPRGRPSRSRAQARGEDAMSRRRLRQAPG